MLYVFSVFCVRFDDRVHDIWRRAHLDRFEPQLQDVKGPVKVHVEREDVLDAMDAVTFEFVGDRYFSKN